MLLSKACTYGLRAALHLATLPPGKRVPIRALGDALGVPYPFLAKVVQTLVHAGLLSTARGPSGGVRLARPAGDVRLREVVEAVDGEDPFSACALGLPGCGDRDPCPLHRAWVEARSRLEGVLDGTTLGDLSARLAAGELRLSDVEGGRG